MNTNLTLLAFCPNLDAMTKEACGWEPRPQRGGRVLRVPTEAAFAYFDEGYINADKVRSSAYTDDIVKATEGWALADASGNILGKYDSVTDAEYARNNSVMKLEVAVPAPA